MNDVQKFYSYWSSRFDAVQALQQHYADWERFGECFIPVKRRKEREQRVANYAEGIAELQDETQDSRKPLE